MAELVLVHGTVLKTEVQTLDGEQGKPASQMLNISVLTEDSILRLWCFLDNFADALDQPLTVPENGTEVVYQLAAKPTKSGNSVSYRFVQDLTAEWLGEPEPVKPAKAKAS